MTPSGIGPDASPGTPTRPPPPARRSPAGTGRRRRVRVRADGVELLGEMPGSGYRTPPALVRRGDGQTIQLTPLLYAVLAAVDGRRTYERGRRGGRSTGRALVTADDVATLCDAKLRAARPAAAGRRLRARAQAVEPAAGAAVAVRRHRPRRHPAADRAVRRAVPPGRRRRAGPGVRRGVLVGAASTRGSRRRPTRRSTSPGCSSPSSP